MLNNVCLDDEFEGYFIAVSPKGAQSIMGEVYSTKRLSAKLKRIFPLIELSEEETGLLISIIVRITEKMKETEHAFQNNILNSTLTD